MAKGSVSFLPVNHDPWANLPKGELGASQGPMSWTDYLPFVKEAINIYGKEKLGELLGAVTAPGDAAAGRLDPGTPEGLKRVQALAGLAMGGPAKPSGAIGAGWQFPHDLALAYWKDSPHHVDAYNIVGYMKASGKTVYEAVKDLGLPGEKADSVLKFYQPKPEKYSHPHNASWSEHPATYGMSDLEVLASDELLEMIKNYGHTPQAAMETVKQYLDSPKEIAAYESAAKKLEEWAGPHGFKFGEAPKAPSSGLISDHPALVGWNDSDIPYGTDLLKWVKSLGNTASLPTFLGQKLGSNQISNVDYAKYHKLLPKILDWEKKNGGFDFAEAPKIKPVSASVAATYTPPKTVPIEEALYPINWADLHSTVRRPGQEASGEYADLLRRAESLGFNTNFPLYHGAFETKVKAPVNPAEGIWGPQAEQYHAFGDPARVKDEERGIFTTDAPEIAAQYSGGSDASLGGGQTFPLFANPKKTLAVDWTAVSGDPSYRATIMNKLIEAAHKREADALVVQGMQDMGGPQNQYVFLRPNVLRSQFAMFDPKKVDSPNLLHAGGLGAMPMFIPVDHDPFAEPTR